MQKPQNNCTIVFITTAPITAKLFLSNQLKILIERGFRVGLITSTGKGIDELQSIEGLSVYILPMQREISLFQDAKSIILLIRLLLQLRPNIVQASTPKAGLLGMLAAYIVRVPKRIFQHRGLRLETTKGMKRRILLYAEKITSACAHIIVCNSNSLLNKLIQLQLTSVHKYLVIGQGSSRGVDIERFAPVSDQEKTSLRSKYGISAEDFVIGFVGRLTKDKGITDLVCIFDRLSQRSNNITLLLIGNYEVGDPIPSAIINVIDNHEKIRHLGFVEDTAEVYNLMDVFAFPSYREGFPNAPLEASASGLPVVGYNVTGTVDAVIDGQTGFLVEEKNSVKFTQVLQGLIEDGALRRQTGDLGRLRCLQEFDRRIVDLRWVSFYEQAA